MACYIKPLSCGLFLSSINLSSHLKSKIFLGICLFDPIFQTTMKIFATVLSVLAFVGVSISQNTCTADDVLNSLSSVEHYADKMQSVTDSSNDDIDPSAVSTNPYRLYKISGKLNTTLTQPIFKNFESQTKHFNGDLQCTFNTALAEQTAICSAYETVSRTSTFCVDHSPNLFFSFYKSSSLPRSWVTCMWPMDVLSTRKMDTVIMLSKCMSTSYSRSTLWR